MLCICPYFTLTNSSRFTITHLQFISSMGISISVGYGSNTFSYKKVGECNTNYKSHKTPFITSLDNFSNIVYTHSCVMNENWCGIRTSAQPVGVIQQLRQQPAWLYGEAILHFPRSQVLTCSPRFLLISPWRASHQLEQRRSSRGYGWRRIESRQRYYQGRLGSEYGQERADTRNLSADATRSKMCHCYSLLVDRRSCSWIVHFVPTPERIERSGLEAGGGTA